MPQFCHVCFLWQAQVQEDVPEVRLAAGTPDFFLIILIPLAHSSHHLLLSGPRLFWLFSFMLFIVGFFAKALWNTVLKVQFE